MLHSHVFLHRQQLRHAEAGDDAVAEVAEQMQVDGGEEEEEEEEEEEIDEGDLVLAAASMDNIDPAILANLPPSVQLDLMTKLREQKTYSNREGFQQRQAQPLDFSQFQMDEYLKASAIRCLSLFNFFSH